MYVFMHRGKERCVTLDRDRERSSVCVCVREIEDRVLQFCSFT